MNFVVALFLLAVALVYATVGQAGGTAFLAVMAVAAMLVSELRPTAQALNIVAASYATWRLQAAGAIDWPMLRALALTALPASFIGGWWRFPRMSISPSPDCCSCSRPL